jgi:phosphohistidine phosphatase
MRLYLVQHGDAKPKQEDPDRPLTETGRQDAQKTCEFVRRLGLNIAAVWHSDRTRAAQTAELLAAAVTAADGAVQRDGLGPNDRVGPLRKLLRRAEEDVAIVGHLPFLAKLAGRLLTGDKSAEPVAFRTGGIVCLERDEKGVWRLAWMVTPDLL